VLADAIGMALTITGTEVPVGEFRLDIKAEDGKGRAVIIENQLERTDHNHIGQCLLYASGLEGSKGYNCHLVSPEFRDDFRRTFDWLNERTDLGMDS
jgi:RecB family endonuclease NucS